MGCWGRPKEAAMLLPAIVATSTHVCRQPRDHGDLQPNWGPSASPLQQQAWGSLEAPRELRQVCRVAWENTCCRPVTTLRLPPDRLMWMRCNCDPSLGCPTDAPLQAAAMASTGNVVTLLGQLRGRSKVQQVVAARALNECARTDAGCAAIAAAGGAAALAQAVISSGSSIAVQEHACLALLQVLVYVAEARAAVVACGAIPRLVQLMGQPGQLGEAAAGVICYLTKDASSSGWGADILAAGGVPALVSALQSGPQATRHGAAMAVGDLTVYSCGQGSTATSSTRLAFVVAGAVPPLVAALAGGSTATQIAALSAFINLVSEPKGAAAAVAAGAVPLLAQRLLSSSAKVQTLAAWAVQNMLGSAHSARQAFLNDANALSNLVSLVSSVSSSRGLSSNSNSGNSIAACTQEYGCGALRNLASTGPRACASIVEAGAIPSLARLLLTCTADSRALMFALVTLVCLSVHTPCCSAMLAAGLLLALQRVLLRPRDDLWDMAAALVQLLSSPAAQAGDGSPDPKAAEAAKFLRKTAADAAYAGLPAAENETPAAAPTAVPTAAAAAAAAAAAEAATAAAAAAAAAAAPARHSRPPAPRICAAPGCGATHSLRRCGGCGTVRYCSEACCKAHWRAHKAECRRLQAERAAASVPAQ